MHDQGQETKNNKDKKCGTAILLAGLKITVVGPSLLVLTTLALHLPQMHTASACHVNPFWQYFMVTRQNVLGGRN